MVKLYRYELFCDEEPQDVGFLVGLEDLGLSSEKEENLMHPFDSLLEIPDLPGMRDSVSFFTEKGNSRFLRHIFQVVSAFQDSIFDIKCCSLDLPSSYMDAVIYQDSDQVCIPRDLYYGELGPVVTREMVSLDECLGDSFRVRNPVLIGDLYHVGTMDISKKSRFSHEGNGLSVSNCPDEWVAITEGFTHGDYFKLSKPDMKLLDFYSLSDDEKKIIQAWAIENGYVREGTLYKSISWDEDGYERYSLFDSYKVALRESDFEEDRVQEVLGLLPTQKLLDQSLVRVEFLDIPDIITALYAEHVLDYDGIYWDEVLDVSSYSAPRGVIFNTKVPTFEVINTTKEQEMSAFLDTQIVIDKSKVTDSARISVIWDSFGIAVDFNYSYDEAQGYGESVLCFCETYVDGAPDEAAWKEAQEIGLALKNKYNLPLDIAKDEMFFASMSNHDAQIRLQAEIKSLYQDMEKFERELQAEYEDGETDWAAQLEVKLEDLERQIVGREELLKQLTAATVKPSLAYQIQSAAARGAESCLADKALVKLPGNER